MDIKQYLEKVKELETSVYNQKLVISHIDGKIRKLKYDYDETSLGEIDYRNHIPRKEKLKKNIIKESILNGVNYFFGSLTIGVTLIVGKLLQYIGFKNIIVPLMLIAVVLYILALISWEVLEWDEEGLKIVFGVGFVILIFIGFNIAKKCNFPKIITITIILLVWEILIIFLKYRKNIKYNQQIEVKYKNEMETFYEEKEAVGYLIDDLQNFLQVAKEKYKETLNILDKIYSFDIIHPKYRSLIPICSFYEYFDTGICNSLKGHAGAYRQYEKDIQTNRIITSLDSINDKLDIIIENQNQLYNELKRIERYQKDMCNKIDYLCQTSSEIAQDTAIIKYQNEIIAKNTEVLKWVAIYDVAQRETIKDYL